MGADQILAPPASYRLFLLSFAVQHALDDPSSSIDLPSYCVLCFEAAERMIVILRDYLGPQGILRYAIVRLPRPSRVMRRVG